MSKDLDAVSIYTIGHSDHAFETFLDLLERHEIQAIVDVRSQPYSQWAPQFNRETLARQLESAGVWYLFMGDSLGGRPADRSFYDAGEEHLNYERLAHSPAYQGAIECLLDVARTTSLAVMCSEGDYRKCHRGKLIAPSLMERGVCVLHIRPDGTVTEQEPMAEQLSLF